MSENTSRVNLERIHGAGRVVTLETLGLNTESPSLMMQAASALAEIVRRVQDDANFEDDGELDVKVKVTRDEDVSGCTIKWQVKVKLPDRLPTEEEAFFEVDGQLVKLPDDHAQARREQARTERYEKIKKLEEAEKKKAAERAAKASAPSGASAAVARAADALVAALPAGSSVSFNGIAVEVDGVLMSEDTRKSVAAWQAARALGAASETPDDDDHAALAAHVANPEA